MALLSQKKPSPSAPPSNEKLHARISKANIKTVRCPDEAESQKKALQNLDAMVKNIYDTGEQINLHCFFIRKSFLFLSELPGMCSFMPPPNSRSDGCLSSTACT
jgi:hypothetical protein